MLFFKGPDSVLSYIKIDSEADPQFTIDSSPLAIRCGFCTFKTKISLCDSRITNQETVG